MVLGTNYERNAVNLLRRIKEAGIKLFNRPQAAPQRGSNATTNPEVAVLNAIADLTIKKYITSQHLTADYLSVKYNESTKTLAVSGVAPDRATREKMVKCCQNIIGVAKVDDRLTIASNSVPDVKYSAGKSADVISLMPNRVTGTPG